jgi:hypothetical protein
VTRADWIALAALVVAGLTLLWTIRQDTRLRRLERRREQRESGAVLSMVPGDVMQWERHHHDVNQVQDVLVHLTNSGHVDSQPVFVFALIDGEHVGRSPSVLAPAHRTVEARVKLDWKRNGDAQPQPVGAGVLTLRATAPTGSRFWPNGRPPTAEPQPGRVSAVRSFLIAALATVALAGCGSSGSHTSFGNSDTNPGFTEPPTHTTGDNVPSREATVFLATAIACSKLDSEPVNFTPLAVSGKGYTTTVQPVRDCKEEAMFNSYVYRVPIPKTGQVKITPGNQQPATLDAKQLAKSRTATVYYARFGSGDYRVSVTKYRKTGDVTGWTG